MSFYSFQDRSGFLGAGSAFSDLYSGVSNAGRTSESIQDSRLRDNEVDVKRTQGKKKHLRNVFIFWREIFCSVGRFFKNKKKKQNRNVK